MAARLRRSAPIYLTLKSNRNSSSSIVSIDPTALGDPPGAEALLLLGLAVAASMLFVYLRPPVGAALLVLLVVATWIAGYIAFTRGGLWVPLVVPSLIQLPVAYGASLLWYS